MELLYLWVEKYNNIEKQGFNFSSKYKFDFDYDKKELNCKDSRNNEEKWNGIEEGFFGDNITNITAIIGKNGSGKSSVLDLILELHSGLSLVKTEEIIFVYKEAGKMKVLYYLSEDKTINLNLNECSEEYELFKNTDNTEIMKELTKTNLIIYSNYIDNQYKNSHRENWTKLTNITTNFLLSYDDKVNNIKDYQKSELLKQLKFFSDNSKFELFKLPTKIYIKRNNEILNKLLRVESDEIYKKAKEMNELINKIEKHINENSADKKEKMRVDSVGMCIISYLLKYEEYRRKGRYGTFCEKLIDYKDIEITDSGDKIADLQKILIDIKGKYEEITDEVNGRKEKRIDDIKKVEKFIGLFLKKMENYNEKEDCIEISLENNFIEIKDFLEKYGECFIENFDFSIFDYNYDIVLSTGEQAMTTIFARVHSLGELIDKNYTFLLDEPDIYMHPEWQRKFLSMFIEFIKTTFKDKKVQIILTSHSPFVVSDLPRENVIFLDKDDKGMCKVVESSEKKKTFGANIHTLLSDGFFMESSLGEFARSKISWVMEILDKDIETIRKEEKKIREILEMIGEPIIKTKLMKMLEDKLNISLINVGEIVEKSERKVKGMQARINEQDKMIRELYNRLKKLENNGDKQ